MDITNELKSLDHGAILLAEGFTLFEAMSATELFDKKIDMKIGLDIADTPCNLLKNGKIKIGSELSQEEIIGLFDLVMKKWMSWLNGHALAQTVYTLVYQYDDQCWDHPVVRALFETLNTVGASIYMIVKEAPFLREEDYNPSVFGFRKQRLTIPQLLQQILNPLDSELSGKLKKSKTITISDGIAMRIKFLKGFTMLVDSLSQSYNQEQHKLIEQNIEFIKKRIDIVIETKKFGVDCNNYQSSTIMKHIASIISMRQIPVMDDEYQYFKEMLTQLEAVLDLSQERNFFAISSKINSLISDYRKNSLIRAYLESSLYKYETFQYFQSISWMSIMINTFSKMYPQNFEILQDKQYTEFQNCLVPITYDYIIRQLRPKFRKMRDFNKLYQHLAILIHSCNQLDTEIFKNKNPLMIFSYEISLQMMITQLQMGFELGLYSDVDYSFIFFYLEYVVSILEKNRSNYVAQLPPQSLQILAKDTKKKKIGALVEQLYNELPYYKGMNCLFRAYSRLFYILMEQKYINQVPQFQERYSNRLKIFEHCYYIKAVNFQEFETKMKSHGNFIETLEFVSQSLQEAQQNFSKCQHLPDQCKVLIKICVMTSVNAMKLKLNPNLKVKLIESTIPYVPQIELY